MGFVLLASEFEAGRAALGTDFIWRATCDRGGFSTVRVRCNATKELTIAKKGPNWIDKKVGARVRMRRLMLGLTQEKLAHRLDLTFQQVQKYEKGTNRIGAGRLQRIAEILQVPVSFFFQDLAVSGKKRKSAPSYVSDFMSSRDGVALTKAFMCIQDKRLRRCIIDLVKAIAR